MQMIGKWKNTEDSNIEGQVQETPQPIEKAPPPSSLGKKVAYDAGQIMAKLERYRDELRSDETRILGALEQVRADIQEADQVIEAMRPAIDVVNKLCTRIEGSDDIRQTVEAVKLLQNRAK